MKPTIQLQTRLTEPQAEALRHLVAALPFKVKYHEEQQGPILIGLIHCTVSQELFVREILHDIGAAEELVGFRKEALLH
jgi:hypothetical protein